MYNFQAIYVEKYSDQAINPFEKQIKYFSKLCELFDDNHLDNNDFQAALELCRDNIKRLQADNIKRNTEINHRRNQAEKHNLRFGKNE